MKVLRINNITSNKVYNRNLSNCFLTKNNAKNKIDRFCKSKEVKENLRDNFLKLRDDFCEKLYPALVNENIKCWNFYINSNDENLKALNEASDKMTYLYKDINLYEKLKKIKENENQLTKNEKKQLENLIKVFREVLETGTDLKELRNIENEISKKYNNYKPQIKGKQTSKPEITKILETEKNTEIREKAYLANIKGADLIAEDLRKFVIKRNEYAKKQGYSDYFEYKLKEEFDVDSEELYKLLDDVYIKTKDEIKKVLEKEKNELKEFFGTEKLESYHYGLLMDKIPDRKVNSYIKNKEQIFDISKKTYENMGYDIDRYLEEEKLKLDLYPRENKNTHGFSFDIDAGKDARILANLTNNMESLRVLNHEMGHSVYTLDISRDLPYLNQTTYPAVTEAVAMMMEDLQKRENILKDTVPADLLEEYKQTFKETELKFLTKALIQINFEKEMYKNPNQDLKKLWHDMKVKYKLRDESEKLDNEWATIPHYLSYPAYYQNYFRAAIMKAQMYNYLKSQLGNITENSKTAEFLKEKLFKFGTSLEENELIKNMTGKKLSVNDFINSVL